MPQAATSTFDPHAGQAAGAIRVSRNAATIDALVRTLRLCAKSVVISDSAEKDVLFDAVVITSGEVGTTAKPRGRLLVAGDTGSEETHRHAIRNHVAAVIPSDVTPDQFGAIWSTVNAGYYPMPANLSSSIVGRLEKPPEDICLSGVERDIMKLLSEGATVANIAERVGCSERHARRRLRSLWDTLGADSRSQALVAATRWGLLGR